MPLGASLSAAELDALGVGRSQHFPKGASKAKTAARKAAKVRQLCACLRPPRVWHLYGPPGRRGRAGEHERAGTSPNHAYIHALGRRTREPNPNSPSAR